MAFADLLRHPLAIVRTPMLTDEEDLDEMGHPTAGTTVVTEVRGLVQPKSAREVALISQAGAGLSDHTIYLLPTDLTGADYIRHVPDDGRRYDVTGVRDAAGQAHHLEVDARLVTGTPDADGEPS